MSAPGTQASSSQLKCKEHGCGTKTYSTQSNLRRHVRSKHGEPVLMSCGRLLPKHTSNIKRHRDKCKGCCQALVMTSTPEQNEFGRLMSDANIVTESSSLDVSFDNYLEDFNNLSYLSENHDLRSL
ncbi:uncharacterized protein CCOS01_02158 [Colletotrichum costaricense]|uniref:C2H2-type domain-containing protein n=1 Tax=Colletotrichum costaricense TaxID=1209916 RepID=A0AAI9Z8T6_9PEZI|nr:uncharacterized protein CCOS01_02158 [Colletotrichum costaricense]KAK1536838.1 hypothetical protein CCOS01_02158 [Colletotrichum costaricense]